MENNKISTKKAQQNDDNMKFSVFECIISAWSAPKILRMTLALRKAAKLKLIFS
jgi:hypothetical protein